MQKPGCSHKMSKEAKALVINAFLNAPRDYFPHGIRLHIDDGCMGGGTNIPYDDYLSQEEWIGWEDSNNDGDDDDGDYMDINGDHLYGNYFTDNRVRIFRYCVFAHKSAEDAEWWELFRATYGHERDGCFVVFDEMLDNDNQKAHTFMHELGHALHLDHPPDNDLQFDLNPFNDPIIDTSMYQGKHEIVAYTNDEWDNLELDYAL